MRRVDSGEIKLRRYTFEELEKMFAKEKRK